MGEPAEADHSKKPWYLAAAILVPAVTAITVAVISKQDDDPPVPPEDPGCVVEGTVRDEGRPFGGLRVGHVPAGSVYTSEERFVYLTTTAPSGTYRVACEGLPSDTVVAFERPGWGGCIHVTDYRLPRKGTYPQVDFEVSDKVMTLLGELGGLPKYSTCQGTARQP